MRAVAQDKDAAAMMGIDVNRTISFTFLIAGLPRRLRRRALRPLRRPTSSSTPASASASSPSPLPCWEGSATCPGAVLGAICIGLIENFNDGLTMVHARRRLEATLIFAILILILVFRPEGLLGERTPEGG